MKNLLVVSILAFGFAFNVQAQIRTSVQVINFGTSAQIQINNRSESSVNCSGPVYLNLQSGRMEVQHYFRTIRARGFDFQTVFLRSFNDRITFAHHYITCRAN